MTSRNDLIVFSHLRWEFVYQRPQHLIERFARYRKVLFVEEAIDSEVTKVISVNENITVIQPGNIFNFEKLAITVKEYCNNLAIQNPILWFYSAAFQKITPYLAAHGIIYDCMDELSAFKNAAPSLIEEERTLMEKADLIFTGGKSLFKAKSQLAKNVFCFPSSVDKKHFEKSLDPETTLPPELSSITRPIIGYCGVIDERIDLNLLRNIANIKKDYLFVMVGPHVKIDQTDLPRAENIIYLGARSYQDLPQYLKAFAIAMMPFALNAATQFISPTKTLEYMAALRPIISTPIYDVVKDYHDVVTIITCAQEFAEGIDKIINENEIQKSQREIQYIRIINQTSWDKTAEAMWKLIDELVIQKNRVQEGILHESI